MDLRLGNCLDTEIGLSTIKDKSIDMILCDLPYGITDNKWDNTLNVNYLFEQYNRIIKDNGVIALFAVQPFATDLINAYRKNFRYEIIWDKHNGTDFFNCRKKPIRNHENILIFYKKQPTYNPQKTKADKIHNKIDRIRNEPDKCSNWDHFKIIDRKADTGTRYPKTILKITRQMGLHPTQKPVALCEWLIKTYTNENELVLDNTFGSGTTAVACKNTNRKFIGYEINEDYYKKAIERLE